MARSKFSYKLEFLTNAYFDGIIDSVNQLRVNLPGGFSGPSITGTGLNDNHVFFRGGHPSYYFDFWRATTGFLNIQGNQSGYNSIVLCPTSGNVGVGDTGPGEKLDVAGNINATGVLKIDDVQVVGNRVTGWTAATGTKSKATFVTDTVTLPDLAARVGEVIDDLISHGIIGA